MRKQWKDMAGAVIRVKAEEYQNSHPAETVPDPTEEPATEPTEPPAPVTVEKFYLIIKTTVGNMSLGATTLWQGIKMEIGL